MMKGLFKSSRFKMVVLIVALISVGALLAAATGHGETAQSTVVGTIFAPCHYVAGKISNALDNIATNIKGAAEYEKQIADLQAQVGELQNQLVDYENLKPQNELYKEFLEIKDEHGDYEFKEASVIGRDTGDIFGSFTISKGSVNGIDVGDAVLYGKYVVGVIDKVYPTYSVVKTVLDADFNASAYELVTNEISYVTGNALLAREGKCKMENLDSSTKITYGSIVCTAGISGTMPRGLIIGTVEEINDEATDISSYAVIAPGVDIDSINSCFVLTNFESGVE